jgi:hypothetical protein
MTDTRPRPLIDRLTDLINARDALLVDCLKVVEAVAELNCDDWCEVADGESHVCLPEMARDILERVSR